MKRGGGEKRVRWGPLKTWGMIPPDPGSWVGGENRLKRGGGDGDQTHSALKMTRKARKKTSRRKLYKGIHHKKKYIPKGAQTTAGKSEKKRRLEGGETTNYAGKTPKGTPNALGLGNLIRGKGGKTQKKNKGEKASIGQELAGNDFRGARGKPIRKTGNEKNKNSRIRVFQQENIQWLPLKGRRI